MTSTLRRFSAPTRWAGIPMRAWLAGSGLLVVVIVAVAILRPPFLLTAGVVIYAVVAPALGLVLWSWFTGVPVLLLLSDFARSLLRRRPNYSHDRHVDLLTRGVAVLDQPERIDAPARTWNPDANDHQEVGR